MVLAEVGLSPFGEVDDALGGVDRPPDELELGLRAGATAGHDLGGDHAEAGVVLEGTGQQGHRSRDDRGIRVEQEDRLRTRCDRRRDSNVAPDREPAIVPRLDEADLGELLGDSGGRRVARVVVDHDHGLDLRLGQQRGHALRYEVLGVPRHDNRMDLHRFSMTRFGRWLGMRSLRRLHRLTPMFLRQVGRDRGS